MSYLYHMVHNDMEGNVLYPLNQLKTIFPKLYEKYSAKYKGREEVTELVIPALNCLWNDVLHFSPVHPKLIKDVYVSAGHYFPTVRFYQIDPEMLDPKNTIIFLNEPDGAVKPSLNPNSFITYSPEVIAQHTDLPQAAIDFFNSIPKGAPQPNMHVFVPHVLYKGSLDISDVEIITI